MKIILTTLLLNTAVSFIGFSQEILQAAEKPPVYNTYGDPLTNITDADGARQGDWFYVDVEGQEVLQKKYKDHVCVGTYYFTRDTEGDQEWKKLSDGESSQPEAEYVKELYIDFLENSGFPLKSDQQLILVISKNGELIRVSAMGNWNAEEVSDIEGKIYQFAKNTNITLKNDVLIIL